DIFILEQFADIRVARDLFSAVFGYFDLPVKNVTIHVTEGYQTRAFLLAHFAEMVFASAAKTHHRVANVAVGAHDSRAWRGLLRGEPSKHGHRSGSRGGGFKKISAIEFAHNLKGVICRMRNPGNVLRHGPVFRHPGGAETGIEKSDFRLLTP